MITRNLIFLGLAAGLLSAADAPQAEIKNDQLRVKVYLPDAKNGFYNATRFDWSGVISSLEYKGHNYYGPWWDKIDPKVYDYAIEGNVVSAASPGIGPIEEFQTDGKALGYDDAKVGETFVKIGVGVLRKPDEPKYDHYKTYEIVDGGKWTVKKNSDWIQFTQELNDPSSGYAYTYQKTVRLMPGKPEMVLEHSLKNVGTKLIRSTVFNQNFLVLDGQPPGPDFSITFPFQLQSRRPPAKEVGEIRGNQIVYLKTLENQERLTASAEGFGDSATDFDIRIENRKVGAGLRMTADHPLSNVGYWSIRKVIGLAPYIAMSIAPGSEFTWKLTYEYYTIPALPGLPATKAGERR